MRVGVTIAAVALALAASFGAAASSGSTGHPRLAFVGKTIRGMHFAARERVRVTFTGSVVGRRMLRATSVGTFATAIPAYDPCLGSLTVAATGATGDAARLKLPQRACPPSN